MPMISSRGSNLHFLPAAFDCFHSSLDSFINSHTHASTHTQIHTHADRVGRTHLKQVDCLACVWCESGVGDSAQVREKERKKERKGDSKTVREVVLGGGRGSAQQRGRASKFENFNKLIFSFCGVRTGRMRNALAV